MPDKHFLFKRHVTDFADAEQRTPPIQSVSPTCFGVIITFSGYSRKDISSPDSYIVCVHFGF